MKQVLVNIETLEKTARLAELAAANEEQLTKLAAERENFNTKLVPEIIDEMIKNGVISSGQREKAAADLRSGDLTKLAHTLLFVTGKVGAPSMGTPAPESTSKTASTSSNGTLNSYDTFAQAILGR